MEVLGGIAAIAILLWVCSGSSNNNRNNYEIEDLGGGFYSVKDNTGSVVFSGTKADCENWINNNQ